MRRDLRRAADPNLISGRMVAHRDGYGFVVPDKPIPGVEGDLFIGRDGMGDAMHGDTRARAHCAAAQRRASGRAHRADRRAGAPDAGGSVSLWSAQQLVLPYDTRIHHEVLIPPGDELSPELREKLREASGAASSAPIPWPIAEHDSRSWTAPW